MWRLLGSNARVGCRVSRRDRRGQATGDGWDQTNHRGRVGIKQTCALRSGMGRIRACGDGWDRGDESAENASHTMGCEGPSWLFSNVPKEGSRRQALPILLLMAAVHPIVTLTDGLVLTPGIQKDWSPAVWVVSCCSRIGLWAGEQGDVERENRAKHTGRMRCAGAGALLPIQEGERLFGSCQRLAAVRWSGCLRC